MINYDLLNGTSGDYYSLEQVKSAKVVRKLKFMDKASLLIFFARNSMNPKSCLDQINSKGWLLLEKNKTQFFFKKVGNP